MLAVVRRMQRQQVDEVTVGVEIIARRAGARADAQLDHAGRSRPAATPTGRSSASTCRRTRTTGSPSQRSLIGPDDKFMPGGMVELDTGNARYLIRFTQTLEQQAGWAWAMFNAVRKLAP